MLFKHSRRQTVSYFWTRVWETSVLEPSVCSGNDGHRFWCQRRWRSDERYYRRQSSARYGGAKPASDWI